MWSAEKKLGPAQPSGVEPQHHRHAAPTIFGNGGKNVRKGVFFEDRWGGLGPLHKRFSGAKRRKNVWGLKTAEKSRFRTFFSSSSIQSSIHFLRRPGRKPTMRLMLAFSTAPLPTGRSRYFRFHSSNLWQIFIIDQLPYADTWRCLDDCEGNREQPFFQMRTVSFISVVLFQF